MSTKYLLVFLLCLIACYLVSSKAVVSEDDARECNSFSGWQTCARKRILEKLDKPTDEELSLLSALTDNDDFKSERIPLRKRPNRPSKIKLQTLEDFLEYLDQKYPK